MFLLIILIKIIEIIHIVLLFYWYLFFCAGEYFRFYLLRNVSLGLFLPKILYDFILSLNLHLFLIILHNFLWSQINLISTKQICGYFLFFLGFDFVLINFLCKLIKIHLILILKIKHIKSISLFLICFSLSLLLDFCFFLFSYLRVLRSEIHEIIVEFILIRLNIIIIFMQYIILICSIFFVISLFTLHLAIKCKDAVIVLLRGCLFGHL